MNKFKLFIENFIIYGVGGTISKIIPLIMVPIVTRLMPDTSYYGVSDLSHTLVQFGSAFAVLGMYDAMYRMFFEKEDAEYRKIVCSTTLFFTIATSIIVFILMISFRGGLSKLFFGDYDYKNIVVLSAIATLVGATNSIISAPVRMQNRRALYLAGNTISPIISYSISIPLLLKGYYLVALPIAAIISGATMELVFFLINRKWFSLKRFDSSLLKPMLVLALPLLPSVLIYWVFNSCDKIMIANILGTSASGIYSVASKLGHCSQLIYLAFAGGWQYFAFSTMREENQVKTNSVIFEYLGVISFISTALVCFLSKPIFTFVFTESYFSGFISAPYLFFAPLLQMLYQVIGNQFLVLKKTWPTMLILSSGAIVNVLLNTMMIPRIGIEGASIATLCGYIFSLVVCSLTLLKMKQLVLSRRFLLSVFFMIAYFISWRFWGINHLNACGIVTVLFVVLVAALYKTDIHQILVKTRSLIKVRQS